jgi:hypothetical protein
MRAENAGSPATEQLIAANNLHSRSAGVLTMRAKLMTVAFAAAAAMTLNAQTPQPQSAPTPQTPPRPSPTVPQDAAKAAQAATNQTITITGCLKDEKDVPGLKPNAAERAGVMNDYVLTDVKMSPSSSVSGIGVAARYEIEGIAEAELKKHVNHQVELTGQAVQAATGAAASADDAPDFKATAIKMVSATCTTK